MRAVLRSLRIVRVHDLSVSGGLSRVSWKLSRTVLRGGTDGNIGPLLGKKSGKVRQPHCFEMNDRELFAFAGLWDSWKNPQGERIESCTILTTTANELVADIHDRMPVIVTPDKYDLWLDPDVEDFEAVKEILRPYDASLMRQYPVSPKLNNPKNEDPELASRVVMDIPYKKICFNFE